MSKRARLLFYVIGFWALGNALIRIYWFKLWDELYFFAGFVRDGATMIGAILGIAALFFVIEEKSRLSPFVALLLVIALTVFFLNDASGRWGIAARFWIEKLGYESMFTKLQSAPNEIERNKICVGKRNCDVEMGANGRPEQVVFPWTSDDVMFGWYGIVYDRTGAILEAARSRDKRAGEGYPVKQGFFGCALLEAQPLTSDWYFCHFWHH